MYAMDFFTSGSCLSAETILFRTVAESARTDYRQCVVGFVVLAALFQVIRKR